MPLTVKLKFSSRMWLIPLMASTRKLAEVPCSMLEKNRPMVKDLLDTRLLAL
ncbi:hypothetical protein D3C74_407780 [compost metagenome]